jgi:hypothetical protein
VRRSRQFSGSREDWIARCSEGLLKVGREIPAQATHKRRNICFCHKESLIKDDAVCSLFLGAATSQDDRRCKFFGGGGRSWVGFTWQHRREVRPVLLADRPNARS